jgi:glycosyltransferase involved in cell wall biosynthesis
MNNNKLVSIITPLYNSEKTISDTIDSVINQTYYNWEMIIVDDCSTDNSVDIVKSYIRDDLRIKLIQLTENSGPAVARNVGLENSLGRFIAFLDSDDLWFPQKLDKQISFMLNNDYVFTFSAYERFRFIDDSLKTINVKNSVSYQDLLKTNHIGCLTAMYDAHKIGKHFFPVTGKHEDYACWLSILKKDVIAYGLNEVLAKYRISSNSFSSNKLLVAKHQWNIYRQSENLSLLRSLYYFLHYTINGFIKHG